MSWSRYYRYGYPRSVFRQLNWYVGLRLSHHLQRRSQRPFQVRKDRQSMPSCRASACGPFDCLTIDSLRKPWSEIGR